MERNETQRREKILGEELKPLYFGGSEYRNRIKTRLNSLFGNGMNSVRVLLTDSTIHDGSAGKDLLRGRLKDIGYNIDIEADLSSRKVKYYGIIMRAA